MIRYNQQTRKRDPSIALINVVFLMLIFFLIAGTIAVPLPAELELVNTRDLEGREPPDALVLDADGVVSFRGEPVALEAFMAGQDAGPVRIVPDRASNATRLIEVTTALRRFGATSVFLVTEQASE